MKNILLAYIPVLHDGYRELFEKYSHSETDLWILGNDFANQFKEIKKDIRRLDPELVAQAVANWDYFKNIQVVSEKDLFEADLNENQVIMPNDVVMKQIVEKYFPDESVIFEPIFLRWDKHTALAEKKITARNSMAFDEFDQKIMKQAFAQAVHSTDWWRHVGGVTVRDGEVLLLGFNKHLPTENAPYFFNDVRSLFSQGQYFELISSIHAEAMMIAEAAKRGIALDGASMYVTTFPCPVCAKQVAQAGIKKLYFCGEYGMLDGEDVMQAAGVELIHVLLKSEDREEIRQWEEERSVLRQYE